MKPICPYSKDSQCQIVEELCDGKNYEDCELWKERQPVSKEGYEEKKKNIVSKINDILGYHGSDWTAQILSWWWDIETLIRFDESRKVREVIREAIVSYNPDTKTAMVKMTNEFYDEIKGDL